MKSLVTWLLLYLAFTILWDQTGSLGGAHNPVPDLRMENMGR